MVGWGHGMVGWVDHGVVEVDHGGVGWGRVDHEHIH